MVKARNIKLVDKVGDITVINLDDISYMRQDLDTVSVKFKGNKDEYKFTDLTEESIEELFKLI